MTAVLEHAIIERLAAGLPRCHEQLNRLHESDAELIRLPNHAGVLAVTTDGLAEEIATGLYGDPELIGWMLVTINASDLAAVGAEPLGMMVCETLPPDVSPRWLHALSAGIRAACEASGLGVLGGDTNAGEVVHLVGTALGLIPDGHPLTRCGARPGDRVYASGPLGLGGAYALSRLAARAKCPTVRYRPRARLAEGRLLRGLASACIDTSDGALAALDELARRNGVGFRLDRPIERWTHAEAGAAAAAAGLPLWMLHAGPHGEFELVFTVPADREAALLLAARSAGWRPVALGRATAEPGIELVLDGEPRSLDTGRMRNLFSEVGGNVERYVAGLASLHRPGAPTVGADTAA